MKIKVKREAYSYLKVDGFNPYDHLEILRDEITGHPIENRNGIPVVCLRVGVLQNWFRLWCQANGSIGAIQTNSVQRDDGAYQFHTRVYRDYKDAAMATEANPDAGSIGSADGYRFPLQESKFDPFQSAQTKSIAEALHNAGFGIEASTLKVGIDGDEDADILIVNDNVETTEKPQIVAEIPSFEIPQLREEEPADEKSSETEPQAEKPKKRGTRAKRKKKEAEAEAGPTTASQVEGEGSKNAEEPEDVEMPSAESVAGDAVSNPGGDYIITANDAIDVMILEDHVGETLSDLSKQTVAMLVEKLASYMGTELLAACKKYIEEEDGNEV